MLTEYRFGRVLRTPWKENPSKGKAIGILVFEVASLMNKLVGLWQSLSDDRIVALSSEILNLEGVRRLVADEDNYLLGLALAEMLDNLGFVARAVACLGKRCSNQEMWGLEDILNDLVENNADPWGWEFDWTKMERKVKKMEKFVAVSKNLYEEMEALSELEKELREKRGSGESGQARAKLPMKIVQQRQKVKTIQKNSLWSGNYNYAVRLLLRSVFTIFRRISLTVAATGGDLQVLNYLRLPRNQSSLSQSSVYPSENNLERLPSVPSCTSFCAIATRPQLKRVPRGGSLSFRGCTRGGIEDQSTVFLTSKSMSNSSIFEDIHAESRHMESLVISNMSFFSPKCGLKTNPPPLTLGAAALELHYANVIVVIEKFARCPHWIALEEREDLYHMLPTSIRGALRKWLKLHPVKDQAHDEGLPVEYWTDVMCQILEWLAPLARNTIRWQSQRTLELQQHLVSKKNVLLLQTLYFANQAKTEAAITDLLVCLNYICRFHGEEDILIKAKKRSNVGDCLIRKR